MESGNSSWKKSRVTKKNKNKLQKNHVLPQIKNEN